MPEKIMIIDGNSIINRAFYAIPLLTNAQGLYTNGVYGFLNIIFKFLEEDKPDYVGVAFDVKAPTFRHEKFQDYKGTRKGMPEELRPQIPLLKDVLDAMNLSHFEMEGYEADDLIGTIAKQGEARGMDVVIVTGDRDALQLASDKVKIRIPKTKKGGTEVEDYFAEDVKRIYGVTPIEFIDVKGLMGDPSDNIPGVPGVGEKTALKLIQQFGSIENTLQHTEEVKGKKLKESLEIYKQQALDSKELATIVTEVPLTLSFEEMKMHNVFTEAAYQMFKTLEFKTLLSKFSIDTFNSVSSESQPKKEYKTIDNFEELQKWAAEFSNVTEAAVILVLENHRLVGVSAAYTGASACVIIVNENLSEQSVVELLRPIFENDQIKKITHDGKKDILYLKQFGVEYKGLQFDTMIAAYILNPTKQQYGFDVLAQEYLNIMIPSEEELLGKGKSKKSYNNLSVEDQAYYMGSYSEIVLQAKEKMKEKIALNDQEELFYEIEMPLIETLASMESFGIRVDKEALQQFSTELGLKIETLEQQIYDLAGAYFNINSPKQLAEILFERLNLPVIKKTKTGYSTAADVLEELRKQHPIIEKILEYRQYMKLKSTYADGLAVVINEKTGKIHSNFNQTITATGRISSTEPNLQNIPIKLEMGRRIRKVFIPSSDEYLFLDVDYSQIELRVFAHLSEDENLIQAFLENQDIHRLTASQVFHVPFDEVTSLQRSNAKAINFGILYGMGGFSLSKDLGITKKEADRYIEQYFEKYPKVKKYIEDIVAYGRQHGYVATLFNRKREMSDLKAKNFAVRAGAERIAMNTPIQGTAADIIKIAMNNVYRILKEGEYRSRLILQVHDELLIEVHREEAEIIKRLVEKEMKNAVQLKVPLEVEGKLGESWYDTK